MRARGHLFVASVYAGCAILFGSFTLVFPTFAPVLHSKQNFAVLRPNQAVQNQPPLPPHVVPSSTISTEDLVYRGLTCTARNLRPECAMSVQ
jgi:hypothetical protein